MIVYSQLKRLGNDIIVSTGIIIIVFAVHVSTMFTRLQVLRYISLCFYEIFPVITFFSKLLLVIHKTPRSKKIVQFFYCERRFDVTFAHRLNFC